MKTIARIAMVSAILLLSVLELFAQNDVVPIKIKKSYWFDPGLGWGGQGTAFELGFSYEVTKKSFDVTSLFGCGYKRSL